MLSALSAVLSVLNGSGDSKTDENQLKMILDLGGLRYRLMTLMWNGSMTSYVQIDGWLFEKGQLRYLICVVVCGKTSGEKGPSFGEDNPGFCITITLLHIHRCWFVITAQKNKNNCASAAFLFSVYRPSGLFPVPQVEINIERTKVWIYRCHHGKFARATSRNSKRSLPIRFPELETSIGTMN